MKNILSFIKRLLNRQSFIASELEGGNAWYVGQIQFSYLLKEGLLPKHYLLDIPCGSFRAGRFFINYLEEGHYYGIDGDRRNIENGIKHVLFPAKLTLKQPHCYVVKLTTTPFDFYDFTKTKFDYIWIHALFDHIPPEVIKRVIIDLAKVTIPGGRIYATIFLNPHGATFLEPMVRPWNDSLKRAVVTYPDKEYWHHTIDFFEGIVTKTSDLRLDGCLYDYPHPLGLRILRFVRSV